MTSSVRDLARTIADDGLLFHDESPFRATVAEGSESLIIVTGDNASGKSLFVRSLAAVGLERDRILPVSVSIRERTESGVKKAIMFGEEHDQSTGANSAKVCETAFKNLDRPEGSILILDEPEIGLSEDYARAMGEFISSQDIPDSCLGVVVVTHSRPLVAGVLDGLKGNETPTHVELSADGVPDAGIDQWLIRGTHRSVADLMALRAVGHERWKTVNALLKT